MSATSCTQCGSAVEADDGFLTCTNCGDCQEATQYVAPLQDLAPHTRSTTGIPKLELALGARRYDLQMPTSDCSPALNKWRKIISNGSVALKIENQVPRTRAIGLFKRLYTSSTTIRKKKEAYKRGLCAACLHVACQEESRAVTVVNVCGAVQASRPSYTRAVRDLKKTLNVCVAYKEQLDRGSVSVCLEKHGVQGNGPEMEEMALQILLLAKDCQIHVGCIPEPLILAASFLAWQRKAKGGFKRPFGDFVSSEGSLTMRGSCLKRIRELRRMLFSMLSKVPWLDSTKVEEADAVKYLDDIVRHQNSLKLTQTSSDLEDRTGICVTSQLQLERGKKYGRNDCTDVRPSSSADLPSWSREQDLDRQELDENDIPDSEMDKYIYPDRDD